MEYRKHITTKIIRTEHHVVIWPGGSVANLMRALSPVPINAKLTDIEDVEGTSQIKLIFLTEDAVQPSPSGDSGEPSSSQ
jgi:uncharacterized repeat protein (TIGR03917 family)